MLGFDSAGARGTRFVAMANQGGPPGDWQGTAPPQTGPGAPSGAPPAGVPAPPVNPYVQGPGAPVQPAAGAAPPKSKALLFIGIGCGFLALLGIAIGIVAYFLLSKTPEVAAIATGGSGGPECDRVAACCKRVIERQGSEPSLLAHCDNFKQMPRAFCTKMQEGYAKTAQQAGIACE